MEAKGKTGSKREGKFRSCRRKERKGFHGKKAWKCKGKQRKMAEITHHRITHGATTKHIQGSK